ncbi:hypothetical protein G9A89_019973 [Geosiphon pyriformis]|nr:hypothetical protein G9A89_019973 [Geosiphon pyriformis]
MASTLVFSATFKIKLAHIKAVFQSVHGFLGAKSVSKDNVKLFCVEFTSQQSLEAAFLVELTSSVHLATFKIAKSLVVSESGSSSAAVALHNIPLGVSTADIKMALGVFGEVAYVVLKPAGVWQYVIVYFKELDAATAVFNHWSILVGKDSVRILPVINQNKAILSQVGHLAVDYKVFSSSTSKIPKVFKSHFVSFASYAKTAAPSGLSEFPLLVASSVASAADPAVGSKLDSLKKQISDLAALVKSIVEPIGFLVALVSRFLDDNAVKAV